MTISSTLNRIAFTGNGVTTAFPITYVFFTQADLVVLEVTITTGAQVVKVLNSDYTISGVTDSAGHYSNGGTVNANVAPPSTVQWVVYRDPVVTQLVSLTEGAALPVKASIESPLDYLTMLEQRSRDLVSRSLAQPDGDVVNITKLPSKVARASSFLAFDANGNPISAPGTSSTLTPVSAFIATLLSAADAPTALAILTAAAINSQAFIGTPTLPTGTIAVLQTTGNNTTAVATTSFTQQEITSNLASHPRVPVRQTVLGGRVDANGAANWLVIGTGLQVDYAATLTPVVITGAAGYDASGEVDSLCILSVDQTNQFTSIPANTTNFLYVDRASATTITGNNIPQPPQYGEVFDQTQNCLLHFDGTNGQTTTTDDYGNTWALVGGTLTTAQKQFGTASLVLSGAGQYAEWVPPIPARFAQQGYGWTIEGWFRFNVLPTAGQHMSLFNFGQNATTFGIELYLFNNAGSLKLEIYLSSNGISRDIVNGTVGVNTTWAINTQYHIAMVFDPIQGKYFVYFNGAQDISVTANTPVSQVIRARIGETLDASLSQMNGWVDEFRVSPSVRYPNGTTFTPAVSAFTVGGHYFSIPQMKMFEITSASSTAGSDPGMTNRPTRVFVGECDSSGAAITAVRSYAYRGRYVSPDTVIPSPATTVSFTHNLGLIPLIKPVAWVRCYTTESGYIPGSITALSGTVTFGSAYGHENIVALTSRTVASITTDNTSALIVQNRSTGVDALATSTNWRMFVTAQRGW
jgi:hypothetical protein